jgi:hypothetical protein
MLKTIWKTCKYPPIRQEILTKILQFTIGAGIAQSATEYVLKGRCSISGKGKRLFSIPQRPEWLWGPPSLQYNGTEVTLPRVKRPGREADHSLPSSGEVKNCGAIPPLPRMSAWLGT